jgi:hypothetical protein
MHLLTIKKIEKLEKSEIKLRMSADVYRRLGRNEVYNIRKEKDFTH